MFTSYLASVSNHQLAYLKSYWCMYAYLNLSKHNKDLTKQNSIPLSMYVVILTVLYKSLWLFASRNWSILLNIIMNSTQV